MRTPHQPCPPSAPPLTPTLALRRLPRAPKGYTAVDVVTADAGGGLPLQRIRERYTQKNLPVLLRPSPDAGCHRRGGASSNRLPAAQQQRVLAHEVSVRVNSIRRPYLSAQVFGGSADETSGDFYPTTTLPWGDFLAAGRSGGGPAVCAQGCYAARVSLADELPELGGLLPAADAHPLAITVGEPYPGAPVGYAGHGRGEATPIHFDEEENWLFVLRGHKRVVLYEPHTATDGRLPRHPVYRTTSEVPPHSEGEREVVEAEWPGLAGARPLYVNVSRGEALYIPAFWWHGIAAFADPEPEDGEECAGSVLGAGLEGLERVVPAAMSVAYWAKPPDGKFKTKS